MCFARFAISLSSLIMLSAVIPTSAADTGTWSLDGVRLGVRIDQVIALRGKPQRITGNIYYWNNAAGGTLKIETDPHGNVAEIDVKGGPHEVRTVPLPAAPPQDDAVLGESGHVNYSAPNDAIFDQVFCSKLGLSGGEPCESYRLPGGAILVIDFGSDVGMADGLLSEIVLAAPGFFGSPSPGASATPTHRF
jgi:hypothetical protein